MIQENNLKISGINDIPIIESEEINSLLDWLQMTFLRFPKIDNYKYYEKMKSKTSGGNNG